MANWQRAADLDEVWDGVVNKAVVADIRLILLRQGDEIFAYDEACPHEGHPLSQGELVEDVVVCARHLWEFEIRTGRHISRIRRPQCDLKPFPVRITDGAVEVDVAGGGG